MNRLASISAWFARARLAALVLLLVAGAMPAAARADVAPATPTGDNGSGGLTTVFLVVLENHDWSSIKGKDSAPYLNSLLARAAAAYAGNYRNVPPETSLHPSEPNYIRLEAGTTVFPDVTFTEDGSPSVANSTASTDHLVALLQAKGIPWKAYQEGVSGTGCPIANDGSYTPRHDPVLFFQDVVGSPPSAGNAYCRDHVRPYSELAGDLQSDAVRGYNVLTPDLCHDMHSNDCPGSSDVVRQGDDWLKANLPAILTSPVYQGGRALVAITWDEGGRATSRSG